MRQQSPIAFVSFDDVHSFHDVSAMHLDQFAFFCFDTNMSLQGRTCTIEKNRSMQIPRMFGVRHPQPSASVDRYGL